MRSTSSLARLACAYGAALAVGLFAFAPGAQAGPREGVCGNIDYSRMIMEIIKGIPDGGGYSLRSKTVELPTITAHNLGTRRWQMRVYAGRPTHCTGATYAVFAKLVAELQNSGAILLRPSQLRALAVLRTNPNGTARTDGQGPFAIFNSNGAGAAALIQHTGTGFSFRDDKLTYARPGDFLKLFWNGGVGSNERGHQAIYTGRRKVGGRDMVCFWSSQRQTRKRRGGRRESLYFPASDGGKVHNGYDEVCRPRTDIKAMIFSRITCMEHLAAGLHGMATRALARGGTADLFTDEYLYAIRTSPSDQATLDRNYDIQSAPSAFADSGIAPLR
jgi:hypothetical protein